jgi:Universal stress protein family
MSIRTHSVGVLHVHPILGKGAHVGKVVCAAIEVKQIDYVVCGRRGMNPISRLLSGSNSTFLLDKAQCNVVVVKGEYRDEVHDYTAEAIRAEEAERARRIREACGTSAAGGSAATATAENIAEEHVARAAVVAAEEEERKRRVEELFDEEHLQQQERFHSGLNKHITVMAEEGERIRRTKEDRTTEKSHEEMAAQVSHLIQAAVCEPKLGTLSGESL